MGKQCIAFVTDANFFFPTFVAAGMARQHCRPETDVIIVTTDSFAQGELAKSLCNKENILFIDQSQFFSDKLRQLDASAFAERISAAAMGRLLLPQVLPDVYEQIIYLDGDVQIIGSLSELEDIDVPSGKFLAAPDYAQVISLLKGEDCDSYFNSGVLKFNREGWIGEKAFDYFMQHGGERHDQGALNAVKGDSLITISNRWNFPRHFMHLLRQEQPSIVHFMSHPKPWDGIYFPWGQEEHHVYERWVQKYPALAQFRKSISPIRKLLYKYRSLRARRSAEFVELADNIGAIL